MAKHSDVTVVEAPNPPSEKSTSTTTNPNLCKRILSASSGRTASSMSSDTYPVKGIEVSSIVPGIAGNEVYIYKVVRNIITEEEVVY